MSIQVSKNDGVCLSCHGPLHIIDANDSTMTVCCEDCDNDYQVEPDHFLEKISMIKSKSKSKKKVGF